MSFPAFQENGAFIGDQRYQQLLRMQRLTPPEFESNVRRQLIIEKLRASVTDWLAERDGLRNKNHQLQSDLARVEEERSVFQARLEGAASCPESSGRRSTDLSGSGQ
jgi:hypothetical protein